tara:strand:- start:42 stop:230 length:189 start_codon:yes stop_codon:yes gene_type:complete
MGVVEKTCSLLQCSEWDLFRLAFVNEFGEYDEQKVERHYRLFLEKGVVPFWIGNYQRDLHDV